MGKNIVLVGLMGAGKTSVGRLLAEKFGLDFIDVDEYIETTAGMKISDIFSRYGESKFRELEKNAILNLSQNNDKIISTGGGALEDESNIKNLQANGIMIYLKATPERLFERIKGQNHRPLLKNEKPLETLKELLKKREKNYLKADIIIETDQKSTDETVRKIGEICRL